MKTTEDQLEIIMLGLKAAKDEIDAVGQSEGHTCGPDQKFYEKLEKAIEEATAMLLDPP